MSRSRDYIYCFTIWMSQIVMCPETPVLTEYFCVFQCPLAMYGWKFILDEDRFYFDYFKFVVERNIVAFENTSL